MGGSFKGDIFISTFYSYSELICLLCVVILGRGNVVPGVEFNFYRDPESVYIVFNSLISSITILPLDVDEHLHVSLV